MKGPFRETFGRGEKTVAIPSALFESDETPRGENVLSAFLDK